MVAVGNRYSAEGVTIPGRERKRRRVAGGYGVTVTPNLATRLAPGTVSV